MGEDQIQLEGEWINSRTGEKVIVRNSIIDGDDMVLITNKGNISMSEFSRNYIKASSDDEYDLNGNKIDQSNKNSHQSEKKDTKTVQNAQPVKIVNMDDFYIPEDGIQEKTLPTTNDNANTNVNNERNINYNIIKKVFDKIDVKSKIEINIQWYNFPKDQILTLVDFLDIPLDDISDYIYKNFMSAEEIRTKIKSFLEDMKKQENINKKSIVVANEKE